MKVSFLRPIDQFTGTHRFLQELKDCLQSNDYDRLRFAVAFAKSGPFLRLAPFFREWKREGKKIEGIFGVDLQGTSRQALEFAFQNFDRNYILHSETNVTFHPKFYLFSGNRKAICYQGSHNMTVGGTETNLEGGVRIEIDLPSDEEAFHRALSAWASLLPSACEMSQKLDKKLIKDLFEDGIILDENDKKPEQPGEKQISQGGAQPSATKGGHARGRFPRAYPKPPSPIPKDAFPKVSTTGIPGQAQPEVQRAQGSPAATLSAEALVIQIVPHHNGEVFLSKIAVNQSPAFFGFPFKGQTKPKFPHNPSYPQRVPDPIVNVTVYDSRGIAVLTKTGFQLNTVYYSTKSEIRITFSPDLLELIDPYAIMIMRRTDRAHDYDISIFNPGNPPSTRYQEYLDVCNQTMPSGGKAQARKMGWL